MKEMVGGCCVCSDDRGWDENPLVYCDGHGCNVAVHQACYGIVEVPKGPWFCRKCESQERAARVRCELCPQRTGALKRSDLGGWCHVVCALFIPEAWFLNVQTMEPIVLKSVPAERFSKVCYVCDENKMESKATQGACMQCNKAGCKNHFHVTCAQAHGLLCEEAGSNGDSVKYCGYCIYHYKKLKKDSHIKQIPAFKPIAPEARTPESSPDKSHENGDNRTKSGGAVKTKAETRHVSPNPLASCTSITTLPLPPEPLHSSPQSDSAWKLSTLKSRALHEQKLTIEAKRVAASSSIAASTPIPVATVSMATISVTASSNHISAANHGLSLAPNASATNNSIFGSATVVKPTMSPPSKLSSPSARSPPHITPSSTPVTTTAARFDKFISSPPTSDSPMPTPDHSLDSSSVAKRKQDKAAEKAEKRAAKKRRKAQKRREDEASKSGSTPESPVIEPASYTSMPVLTAEDSNDMVTTVPPTNTTSVTPTVSQSVFGGEPIFHSLSSQHPVSTHMFAKSECESRVFDTTSLLTTSTPPPTFSTVGAGGDNKPRHHHHHHHNNTDFPTTFEQLLERHWDQGNQFLVNQAADFDIGSLLACLQQLRVENQRLATHVKTLHDRRDHLSSVNVKLASSLRPPSEPSPMVDGHRAPRLSSGSDSSVKSLPKSGVATPKLSNSRPPSAHQLTGHPRAPSPSKGSRKTSSTSPDTRISGMSSNPIMSNALQLPPLTDQQRAHFLQQQTNTMIQRSLVENSPPFLYPMMNTARTLPHRPPVSIISAMHSYPVSNSTLPLSAPLHLAPEMKGKEKT